MARRYGPQFYRLRERNLTPQKCFKIVKVLLIRDQGLSDNEAGAEKEMMPNADILDGVENFDSSEGIESSEGRESGSSEGESESGKRSLQL